MPTSVRPSGAALARASLAGALVCLLSVLAPSPAQAQNLEWATPGGPPPAASGSGSADLDGFGGVPGTPDDPEQVPVDGGVVLLGAAGAAYAMRRLRRRQTE